MKKKFDRFARNRLCFVDSFGSSANIRAIADSAQLNSGVIKMANNIACCPMCKRPREWPDRCGPNPENVVLCEKPVYRELIYDGAIHGNTPGRSIWRGSVLVSGCVGWNMPPVTSYAFDGNANPFERCPDGKA